MSAQLNAGQPEALEMVVESSSMPNPKVAAFGLSLSLHVIILAALMLVKITQQITTPVEVTTSLEEDVEAQSYRFDSTITDQVGSSGDVSTGMAASQEAAVGLSRSPQAQVDEAVSSGLQVNVPTITEEIPRPSGADVLASVATTGTTENAGGVEGAVDRISYEIASALREKKALVVWLFDVSPSLAPRRAAIADRVENVYNQLTQLNVAQDKVLKSAVAVFGEQTRILTKEPVDDPAELVKVVRGIKSESSGMENTFAAVNIVAKQFQSYRTQMHRDVMIIIVTDEAGSDPANLEMAIQNTKKYGIRCYCVGDAAPFGKETVEETVELESGEVVTGIMHKGPETFYPERMRLPYWGTQGYDLENLSSGFGPYGLTRLCSETNGMYLVTSEGRGHKFNPQVMRNYAPDYRPIKMLDADISQNKAKAALIEVCKMLKVDSVPIPRNEFPAENDNVLRQAITEAQRPLADFEYRIDSLLRVLEPGEKDRAKIRDARSRAGFDLAMGRLLALRARSFGYNSMLAEMRSSPKKFEKQDSNQWRLVASKDISSGATTKKLVTRAMEYLKRVVDEHPDTPWQMMAERELSTPLGWEWKESHYEAAPMAGMGNAGKEKAGPKFVEVEDAKTGKRTKKMVEKDPVRRDI